MARTIQQLFDLTGKNALVTGGSHGLGLQMAYALGEAGARIMLCGHHADDLEGAMGDLQAAGIDARWVAADCAREAELHRVVDETLHRMGAVDILVNNAGATWPAPAEHHPVQAWDQVMDLNVRSYFLLSQYVARHSMIPRRFGRIINVAATAHLGHHSRGWQDIAGHTCTGAIVSFTRALASEWGRHNITVNAIFPGPFSFGARVPPLPRAGEFPLTARAPLRRPGDDEDLKGLTVLYASDAGKHITGQWMAVDGGASVSGGV